MNKLDGKEVAQFLKEKNIELIKKIKEKNEEITLAIILPTNDPSSLSYLKGRMKMAENVGINIKTITFDNGGEFRNWKALEKSYDNRRKKARTQVYYAHPYRSGERGSNENANRLIRRFIPKGTDITPISEEFIQYIEAWINNYPRAMFGYKSSNMVICNI